MLPSLDESVLQMIFHSFVFQFVIIYVIDTFSFVLHIGVLSIVRCSVENVDTRFLFIDLVSWMAFHFDLQSQIYAPHIFQSRLLYIKFSLVVNNCVVCEMSV